MVSRSTALSPLVHLPGCHFSFLTRSREPLHLYHIARVYLNLALNDSLFNSTAQWHHSNES